MQLKFLEALERANEILLDRCNFSICYNEDYIYMSDFRRKIFINNAIDMDNYIEYGNCAYGRSAYCELVLGGTKYSYALGLGNESVHQEFDSFKYISGTGNTSVIIEEHTIPHIENERMKTKFIIKIDQFPADHTWSSTSSSEEVHIYKEYIY